MYNMKHSRFMFVILILIGLVVGLISPVWTEELTYLPKTASSLIAADPSVCYTFALMIMCVFVAYLCAGDMKEKVINYEVLSGHSRAGIYFSRTILTVIFTTLFSMILSLIPVIVSGVIYGWGNTMEFKYAILRLLCCAFPYMRLAAFMCFLAFWAKKATGVMVWGYIAYMFGTLFASRGEGSPYLLTFKNVMALMSFNVRSVYNISMEKGIIYYSKYLSEPEPGLIGKTILASLVITVIYLLMGYGLFRREDLN
ncbi:MAG: hypothetical protein K5686_00025 [Lachnospiraceae bacterium]|nr:hypothetical protein [Lachnospiraceae bacterium]